MSLMGVDVGTTGVKAVVFDETGRQLSTAYEEYPLLFPFAGASELDSRNVVEAACRVIGKAAGEVKASDPVKGIGIASQGEAFTPVAADGSMLGNAMTSSDGRAEPYVRACDPDWAQRLYEITGHTPYPMYSLFKLMWLKENQPEVWGNTWKFLFCQDLLAFVLTGEAKTDYSMAARSMLFDVDKKAWSGEILGSLGLNVDQLPGVVPSGTIFGNVRPELATAMNLGADVGVTVCGHDQPVGALGCGAASPGCAAYSIGTVECICPSADHLILSPELMAANLASYPHVLPNAYTTVAFNITGGSVLKWVRDNYAVEEAAEARRQGRDPYELIIGAASSEPANVVLLPHFGPTGTPHFDSEGTGVLFGLNLSTTRAEVLRAVLEGITFEMKWNLSILADSGFVLTDLRAVGGGARSETWMQIKADILQTSLSVMRVTEATCMGAAILAGSGLGLFDARSTSLRWAQPDRSFEPSAAKSSVYEDRFAIYKELYNSLGVARHKLHELKGR
jgi:xylulokinase